MRYRVLLVFTVLLSACSVKADQAVPNTQEAINPTVQTDAAPTQAVDLTVEPEVESQQLSELPNLGPAPELTNEVWLNTDQPLPLADLKGKVVLLEMWTFG